MLKPKPTYVIQNAAGGLYFCGIEKGKLKWSEEMHEAYHFLNKLDAAHTARILRRQSGYAPGEPLVVVAGNQEATNYL